MSWGANEIEFVENELAALAETYDLELDEQTQENISKRKKKNQRKRKRTKQQAPVETKKTKKSASALDFSYLKGNTFPKQYVLHRCKFPGCKCKAKPKLKSKTTAQSPYVYEPETLKGWKQVSCAYCEHGVLNHVIYKVEPATTTDQNSTSLNLQGRVLLRELFDLVRFGRVACSIVNSITWTESALENLTTLIVKAQKYQRLLQDPNKDQIVLSELSNLHTQGSQILTSSTRDELPIRLAIVFDKMYFQLYYASIVDYGRNGTPIAHPVDYFLTMEKQIAEESTRIYENFIQDEIHDVEGIPSDFLDAYARESKNTMELLDILLFRMRETSRLFYEKGVEMGGEMSKALATYAPGGTKAKKVSSKKRHKQAAHEPHALIPPPCPPLLQAWRDNCRDWCCHLFAYATPNGAAIDAIKEYQPLVEVGAGTGYWTSLLRERSVDIKAFDKAPPQADEGNKKGNEFHANVPVFCEVEVGGPEVLAKQAADTNLFLCYPPPFDPMARDCLRHFQGKYILHVGEWCGDTADRRFEHDLLEQFQLIRRVSLPNWSNTAYELTTWKRKEDQKKSKGAAILSCACCGATDISRLRRCRVCRTRSYCSTKCVQADALIHDAEHARRFVFLTKALEFENSRHFQSCEIDPEQLNRDYVNKTSWKQVLAKDTNPEDATTIGESEQPGEFRFNFGDE